MEHDFLGVGVLLCGMYHHVNADAFSNTRSILEDHFKFVRQNLNVVLPADILSEERTNLCMVFDDAGYSFYRYAFPLIRETGIRVVLSVAPKYIVESSGDISPERRLSVPALHMMLGDHYLKSIPFCTWEELSEISKSGCVKIASHSYSHPNLLTSREVEHELHSSKELLEEKLGQEVDTFVFPYGQFNAEIFERVRKYYRYSFAVGAGDNRTWDGVGGVLFRIAADDLSEPGSLFTPAKLTGYRISRLRLYAKKWLMDRKSSA